VTGKQVKEVWGALTVRAVVEGQRDVASGTGPRQAVGQVSRG
jgi:hypothetical protein